MSPTRAGRPTDRVAGVDETKRHVCGVMRMRFFLSERGEDCILVCHQCRSRQVFGHSEHCSIVSDRWKLSNQEVSGSR